LANVSTQHISQEAFPIHERDAKTMVMGEESRYEFRHQPVTG